MKKIFCVLFVLIFGGLFVSCSDNGPAKVTVVDENGEKTTISIEATEDSAKVVDVLTALEAVEITKPKGCEMSLSADFAAKIGMSGMTMEINLDASLSAKADLESLLFYVDGSMKGSMKATYQGETQKDDIKMGVKVHSTTDYAYVSTTAVGLSDFNIKSQKIKYDIAEMREMLESLFDGSAITPPSDVEMPSVAEIVDLYDIVISSTTSSSFTLKMSCTLSDFDSEMPSQSLDVYVTIDTKTMMPSKITTDISELIESVLSSSIGMIGMGSVDCTSKFSVSFKYKEVTIPTLTDDEMAQYHK